MQDITDSISKLKLKLKEIKMGIPCLCLKKGVSSGGATTSIAASTTEKHVQKCNFKENDAAMDVVENHEVKDSGLLEDEGTDDDSNYCDDPDDPLCYFWGLYVEPHRNSWCSLFHSDDLFRERLYPAGDVNTTVICSKVIISHQKDEHKILKCKHCELPKSKSK